MAKYKPQKEEIMPKNQKPNNKKGEFKTWMAKDGIMRTIVTGELDDETAKKLYKQVLKIVEAAPGKVAGISFIDKAGKGSPTARKIAVDILKHPKIGKTALVGASPLIKVMANVMLKLAGMKNAKHFKTEAEAVKWIKQG